MKKFLVLIFLASFSGCTEQDRVKMFGGSATVQLEPCKKLVNLTWKELSLWILTRPSLPGETVQTFEFSEQSSFQMVEGKITIKETACK